METDINYLSDFFASSNHSAKRRAFENAVRAFKNGRGEVVIDEKSKEKMFMYRNRFYSIAVMMKEAYGM